MIAFHHSFSTRIFLHDRPESAGARATRWIMGLARPGKTGKSGLPAAGSNGMRAATKTTRKAGGARHA